MIKIVEDISEKRIIPMKDMKPLEVGKINNNVDYKDVYVMRTASSDKFEIMNLSRSGDDSCWTSHNNDHMVELLAEGEELIISIHNYNIPHQHKGKKKRCR